MQGDGHRTKQNARKENMKNIHCIIKKKLEKLGPR